MNGTEFFLCRCLDIHLTYDIYFIVIIYMTTHRNKRPLSDNSLIPSRLVYRDGSNLAEYVNKDTGGVGVDWHDRPEKEQVVSGSVTDLCTEAAIW